MSILKRSNLPEFSVEKGLSMELPYWEFLEDGIIVLKDGSLVQGLYFESVSIETKTDDEVNQLTDRIRAGLNALPDGMEIQFHIESHSDESERIEAHGNILGKSQVIEAIKKERVEALRLKAKEGFLRKLDFYLFVYERSGNHLPKQSGFFAKKKDFDLEVENHFQKMKRDLAQKIDSIENILLSLGITPQRLSKEDGRGLIYRFLNPNRSKNHPVPTENSAYLSQEFSPDELKVMPELSFPSPREQLCFGDLKLSENDVTLDGFHHGLITLKTLPEWTYASLIARLLSAPVAYTLSILIRVPEQSKEVSAIQAKRRVAFSMLSGTENQVSDLESEAKLESTEELLRELIQTGQKIFFFQTAMILRDQDRDELETKEKLILTELRKLGGAEGLKERYATWKVMKSCLPGGSLIQVRGKRVKTNNLSDFIPIYGEPKGHRSPVCLFEGRSGNLLNYDPFDPSLPNFNVLVTGSSGAGKSFFNTCIQLQHLATDPLVFIIDVGGSYRKVASLMNGSYIELNPPNDSGPRFQINPFSLPKGQRTPSPEKIKFLVSFLETVFSEDDSSKISKLSKSQLEEALFSLYEKTAPRIPTLSDLSKCLKDSADSVLRDYSKMLYPWTGERAYGQLLDGEGSLQLDSDFVVFDLKGLSSYPDLQSALVLIITDFILGRIDGSPQKKRILIDEAWSLLKSKGAAQFMEYCARTLRKTGSGITFVTQGLDEIRESEIGSAILNNTATKVILMQKGDLEVVKNTLKLYDQEMAIISSLRQSKGDFSEGFLMTGDDRTCIRISPTPLEYWVATTDANDLNAIEERLRISPEKSLFETLRSLSEAYPGGMSQKGRKN